MRKDKDVTLYCILREYGASHPYLLQHHIAVFKSLLLPSVTVAQIVDVLHAWENQQQTIRHLKSSLGQSRSKLAWAMLRAESVQRYILKRFATEEELELPAYKSFFDDDAN
jgi:hypothetical protein